MTQPTGSSPSAPSSSVPLPLPEQGVILAPRPWVPLGVVALGLAALALNPWLALGLSLFGLFLLVQSQLLRLQFAADGLRVWRGESLLRHFPYSEWLSWTLFWPPLPVLSSAALEVLAVIAYRQPVTRAEIEAMRGGSASTVVTLQERELVKVVGRSDAVGQPLLYGTTERFLLDFGLTTLADLPPLESGSFAHLLRS